MTRCLLGAAALVLAGALGHSQPARAADSSAVIAQLRQLEETHGGRLGLMAKDLKTGGVVRYNDAERFPTASLIKLPVLGAAFDLADRGRLDLSRRITLSAADKVGGSGILSVLSDSASLTLLDALTLMTVLSDNTATNLVLDRLAPTHDARLAAVNDFLLSRGLKDTRILNRLYSLATKKESPEALRYGIGVSTPADMVSLLEQLYRKTLVRPASCDAMIGILRQQFYEDGIPRFLPSLQCDSLHVAHKTGFVQETKTDAGIVFSDRGDFAMAIFVDKNADHSLTTDNRASLLIARAARTVWNHFTGMTGFDAGPLRADDVDWNSVPGGRWGIFRSPASPFPHPDRASELRLPDGTVYSPFPHYTDSSVVVFVPRGFRDLDGGANLIVHFHGHGSDNLGVLERDQLLQAMAAQRTNALLVLVQGPYRARDSFGGKMESEGGLARLVEDVLRVMRREGVVETDAVRALVISAFSGGYRPGAFAVRKGGMAGKVRAVFLFDALYANADSFREWLLAGRGEIFGAYTDHLAGEYTAFLASVESRAGARVHFTRTPVAHDEVVRTFVADWLSRLGPDWTF
jgi:beta-lactamase class A